MEQIQELEVHEEAYTTYEPLDELCSRHHPDNPKDHDLGSLIESIQEFGFVRNVMINETDNLLLYGHGTTEALWQMYEGGEYQVPKRIKINEAGMWLVPTDRGIRLSKKRAKAYVIADNRHSELGGWNEPRLVDNLIAIAGKDGRGLRGTGFDGDELDTLIRMYRPELIETPEDPGAQLDKAQELQKKWQVERGQIWEIGRHRLMCGDSTSEEDIGRLVDGQKIEAILTDPPYGIDLNTDYRDMPETRIHSRRYEKVEGDDEDFDASTFIDKFSGIKEQFWWGGDNYYTTLPAGGSWIIWDKRNENSDGLIGSHFEVCWSRTPHRKRMIRHHWSGVNARNPKMPRAHPTEKAVDVLKVIIGDYIDEGNALLDLFIGSGTTMVAAEQLNRICYGMEIEPKYCAVTLERMSGMGLTPKLLSE